MTSGFKSMKRCIIAPANTAEREKKKGGKEKGVISFRLCSWRGLYKKDWDGLAYAVEVTD